MNERRRDPTTGEWRMFATGRQDPTFLPSADTCPLCPTRDPSAPTEIPGSGFEVAVFDDRFPSLLPSPPPPESASSPLYTVAPATGATEVVVYSDAHDTTFGDLGVEGIARLVDVWADRYAVLGARDEVAYVFIFENKGDVIGMTLQHPHGQIFGYPEIPPRARLELAAAAAHRAATGGCVFCEVGARERADGVRVVAQNRSFLAFVPFAARFPYEVHVMAQRHAASLLDLSDPERLALAELLETVVRAYDGLFGFPPGYVMSMHQAPTDDGPWEAISHFHIEFTPFHRTAAKLRYLAGSELGAGAFINDTSPEETASELRAAVAAGRRRPG